MRTTGRYETSTVAGEKVSAFVPFKLPPRNPGLAINASLREALSRAETALAKLDAAARMLPSMEWFIYSFVRKEAVISSQIEGTQATLVDLFNHEAKGNAAAISGEMEEVCNYVQALKFARKEVASPEGLPLSIRLLNETHKILMDGVRGANKQPGEIRRSQNWIGGTRPGNAAFVPPPPHLLQELLGALEKYIHEDDDLPPLCRAGLIHAQFETIHPYLDGNGRIGRLLIALLLERWNLLRAPVLYLSLFFKLHRAEYYRRLDAVRTEGDYERWLLYFLEGVETISRESVGAIVSLSALIATDREKALAAPSASLTAIRLFEALPEHPIITIASVVALLEISKPTAAKAVEALLKASILVETTGRKRDRTYEYKAYLDILRTGTEF